MTAEGERHVAHQVADAIQALHRKGARCEKLNFFAALHRLVKEIEMRDHSRHIWSENRREQGIILPDKLVWKDARLVLKPRKKYGARVLRLSLVYLSLA